MALPEPSATVGIKLASLTVHYQEALSSEGHHLDLTAIQNLLQDPEVHEYLAALEALSLLPKKR